MGELPEDLWQDFLHHLDRAEAELRSAFIIMDGWEGLTDEAEDAIDRALKAIETVRAKEVEARPES